MLRSLPAIATLFVLFVAAAAAPSGASAQVVFGEQDFNAVSNTASTTDELPAGSQLTNAGSQNANPANGLTFSTLWAQDTRGVTNGPRTLAADGDSSDFVGGNSFSGANAPNLGPSGAAVAAGVEQNFEFNDTDGRVELRFAGVDASAGVSPIVTLRYWIADSGYEADDLFEILITDGVETETLLSFGEPELESNASADDGTANWKAFAADIPTNLDRSNLQLIVAVDTNASAENLYIDDVAFVDFGQSFNLLSSAGTATTDSLPAGSQLTNAGSQTENTAAGLTFASFWAQDTRAVTSGPVTPTGDTSDFIGVNSFAGSNSPDVGPDGTAAGAGVEHNFEFNDVDGRLELWFDPVDLTGLPTPSVRFDYWINNVGYEADDAMEAILTDGTTNVTLFSYGETELEANASTDDGSANWSAFSGVVPDSLNRASVQLIVVIDNNGADENIFIDNVAFNNGAEPPPPPGPTPATITELQGAGESSPLEGVVVEFTGVVVCDFQEGDELRGFFLQDPTPDGDPNTSDGIFVFDPAKHAEVQAGDLVTVVGTVQEFFGMTEITAVQSIIVNGSGQPPSPTPVNLPEAFDGELERIEGMLVQVQSEMTVAQNFFLGRYGQLTLASPDDDGNVGRTFQVTNLFDAGSSEALALLDENARRLLILDDGQDVASLGDNPVPVPYIGAAPPEVLRAGDTVTGLTGCIEYGRINSGQGTATIRDYRIHPTVAPIFDEGNPRPADPDAVGGRLRVAAFNVLNYFNGDGQGGGFPTSRGASTLNEFNRQRDKIIAAMDAMDAEIIGLMEIENDGYGQNSAIQDLVNGLNYVAGAGTYALVNPGVATLGTDEIAVGLIYKPAIVQAVGTTARLETGAFTQPPADFGGNRVPLAQTFREKATGEIFTVVVNHLKSKGDSGLAAVCSDASADENCDQGDGQGFWNVRRTEAAGELAAWLATDPTKVRKSTDYLIIGDLNAYAVEDPIQALEAKGYTDLVEEYVPPSTAAGALASSGYSYTFDGLAGYLDHAIASPAMRFGVTGVTEWHINTDEPPVIDYDENFNPPGYYAPDAFRASDHDPVIIGLDLCKDARSLLKVVAAALSRKNDLRFDINLDGAVNAKDAAAFAAQLTLGRNGACRLRD